MKPLTLTGSIALGLTSSLGLFLLSQPNPSNSYLVRGLIFLVPLLLLVVIACNVIQNQHPHSAPQEPICPEAKPFIHIVFHCFGAFLICFLGVLLIDTENSKPYPIVILSCTLLLTLLSNFLLRPKTAPMWKKIVALVYHPPCS